MTLSRSPALRRPNLLRQIAEQRLQAGRNTRRIGRDERAFHIEPHGECVLYGCFYDVPSPSTPVKLAFLQGVADIFFFSCLSWHKGASTVSEKANAVKFKGGLQVQVWFWLGQKKKKEKTASTNNLAAASHWHHFTFYSGLISFQTSGLSGRVNDRNRKRAWHCCSHSTRLTVFTICDPQHNDAHLLSNILQIAANCPWLLDSLWQTSVLFSPRKKNKKNKWSLSTVAFKMFRITTSTGWIPCLHLSLGRTDEKKEDVGWILLLHLIKFSAVWSLWWLDGLRRCWRMNRWDFLCDRGSQEAKSDINTSLWVASLFQGQLSCSF